MNTNIKKSTVPRIKNTVKKEKKNLVLWLIWIQLIIISIILGFIAISITKNNSANVATLQLQKKLNDRFYVDYNSNYEISDNCEQILVENLPDTNKNTRINAKLINGIRYIESYLKINRPTEITQNGVKTILDDGSSNTISAKLLSSARILLESKDITAFSITSQRADRVAGETYRMQLAWFAYKKKQQEEKLKLLESSEEEIPTAIIGDDKISFNF